MSSDGVNPGRRKFLTAATSAVGVAGAVGIMTPFVGSWNPSAKARALGAPVKVDIGKLEPGQMITEEWRGKPVYILRRTESQLDTLPRLTEELKDPDSSLPGSQPPYIAGIDRAIRPEILVIIGLCTHLGCAPTFRPEVGAADLGGDDWLGGFFCPCHGSKFDLSGRVYSGVPANKNLVVPPHSYEDENVLVVGVDAEAAS